jgi:hypothetical protein
MSGDYLDRRFGLAALFAALIIGLLVAIDHHLSKPK